MRGLLSVIAAVIGCVSPASADTTVPNNSGRFEIIQDSGDAGIWMVDTHEGGVWFCWRSGESPNYGVLCKQAAFEYPPRN